MVVPAWVVVTGLLVGVDGFLVVVEAAGLLDVVAAGLCEVEVVGFFEVVDAALLDEVVAGFLDVVVAFEVETEVVTGLIEVVVARAVVVVRAVVMPTSPAPQPHEQPQLSTPQWIGKENPKSCDLCLVIQVEGGAVREGKSRVSFAATSGRTSEQRGGRTPPRRLRAGLAPLARDRPGRAARPAGGRRPADLRAEVEPACGRPRGTAAAVDVDREAVLAVACGSYERQRSVLERREGETERRGDAPLQVQPFEGAIRKPQNDGALKPRSTPT